MHHALIFPGDARPGTRLPVRFCCFGGKSLLLLTTLLLFLLAGCAARPPAPDVPPEELLQERINSLLAMPVWRTMGRVGITTAEDSATLSMDWQQLRQSWVLSLRGPIGTGSLRMEGGPDGVVLRSSDGIVTEADDAQELLHRHTGFDLPVEVLQDWLRGIPSTAYDANLELDDFGRLTKLEQLGWRVQYTAYRSAGGIDMPMRLSLQGPGITMRAALRDWEFERD